MHRSFRRFLLHVAPALLYVIAIFVGGSLPQGPNLGLEFEYGDKVLHLLAFGGFDFFAWRAFRYLWPERRPSWHLWTSCVVSIALGGLLEIWQSALPTRQAEGLDWVADSVGALLVTAMLWWHGRVGELGERPTA
jgi:hypothetical protein